ncbi:MAG: HpcH/HpaI aldolase/citrate lyase family protein [FCB group bacterium]|nr:HpcH/HpaI aldolase/citrate lyase family protein [FCB group bacterium]
MEAYTSGNRNSRSDCLIRFTPKSKGGIKIRMQSKVEKLYGRSITALAEKTLTELWVVNGLLEIIDNGALPFVLQARIEAAVKAALPDLGGESLPALQDHSLYHSTRDRFRRSRLYIPGIQPKLMLNAGIHKPDGIILDLEDSVPPAEKTSARYIVRNALRVLDFFGAERMVRINQGALGLEDLEAVVPNNVHTILIPKVESADQLKTIDQKIDEICLSCSRKEPVFLMPILESALGILQALEIAQASPNNIALAIGLEDYTADLGTQRTSGDNESFFARSMLVNAARAAGLQPIDTVYSDVNDTEGLRRSVEEAKALGFDGKGCIHPRQIGPIHQAFTPTASEIEKAQRIVMAYDTALEQGKGVVTLGSKMIDPPVVKRAHRTIDLAVASEVLGKNWKDQFPR